MTPRTSSAVSQNLHPQSDGRGEPGNLSHHYGSIGIQAVAAAARYADRRKNPAHGTAAAPRIDQRFVESAG